MGNAASTECRAEPGEFGPVVDRGKCEGKAECVDVCPFNVFEVRRIDDADFARLGVFGKLKSMAHGRKTAYMPRASACQAVSYTHLDVYKRQPYPCTVYMTSGVIGSMTRLHGRPELSAVAFCPVLTRAQVAPQSVDRNMPLESAPV